MDYLGYDFSDSIAVKAFINEWVDHQIFLQELSKNDASNYSITKFRANAYASELAQYQLENQFILSQLDSIIPDSTIQKYYDDHQQEFILNDYIVKALYVKVPKNSPKQEDIKSSYLLKKNKDLTKVISYAKLYAENFYFNDSSWVYLEEVTNDIPVGKFNKDNLVLNRTKTHFSDDTYTYYLNIIDFKLKDDTPPLEFMKDKIRQTILTQRYNQIKEEKTPLYLQKVKKNHEINIYI